MNSRSFVAVALVLASFTVSSARADMLQQIMQNASKLTGQARANAQTWLAAINASTTPEQKARLMIEADAMFRHATGGPAAGNSKQWGGLCDKPEDVVPQADLSNVELVERGILASGCQPSGMAWELLKRKGIRTVVNLRAEDNTEEAAVRAAGMNPVYIPIVLKTAPTDAQARAFAALVSDPANRPVYVHCKLGENRTHAMVAAWRLTQHAPLADVLAEGNSWGMLQQVQIDFVKAFAAH